MLKYVIYFQSVFVLFLSIIVKYIPPDFTDVNWDIVLFLTPFGIIKNYIEKDNTVMWSFYFDTSTGQIHLTTFQMILGMIAYLIMVCSAICFFKNERLGK
jgi:hypothetical protein